MEATLEKAILDDAERALADGLRLKRWWEQKEARQSYARSFHVMSSFPQRDRASGFFDEAEISSGKLAVMGLVQEMLFDRPRAGAPEYHRDQIREFVLHYLMRVGDYRPPEQRSQFGLGAVTRALLSAMSMARPEDHTHRGFGYTQLFYKKRGTGEIGRFAPSEQAAIIDLRELGRTYEWILGRARPFEYELEVQPLGPAGPRLVIPLPDSPYIAVSGDLVTAQDDPEPGVLGRYGFAYALLNDPTPRGAQVYGPAQYRACFQMIQFEVDSTGESRVRMAFTGDRPRRIFDVPLDPVDVTLRLSDLVSMGLASKVVAPVRGILDRLPKLGGFDPLLTYIAAANAVTMGLASSELHISKEQLERDILAKHFQLYYQLILGCFLAYRQVPDWLDADRLPEWAKTGVTS